MEYDQTLAQGLLKPYRGQNSKLQTRDSKVGQFELRFVATSYSTLYVMTGSFELRIT